MSTWEALKQKDDNEVFLAKVTLSFAEVYKDFEEFTKGLIEKYLPD